MNYELRTIRQSSGFSLIEMLLATGILGIGLVLVAMVFPVGIKLTGIATDRTIGAIAANEAVAKIKLYGLRDFQYWPLAIIAEKNNDPAYAPDKWENATYDSCENYIYATNFWDWGADGNPWTADDLKIDLGWPEFLYPSTSVLPAGQERNTHWSALCRRVGEKKVQVTVFVTRKNAAGLLYYGYTYDPAKNPNAAGPLPALPWPSPVPVIVEYNAASPRQLKVLTGNPQNQAWGAGNVVLNFFNDNVTVVGNHSGQICRVQEYKASVVGGVRDTLVLTENWEPSSNPASETVWVVPPAVGSDRYPVIAVRQTTITIK